MYTEQHFTAKNTTVIVSNPLVLTNHLLPGMFVIKAVFVRAT